MKPFRRRSKKAPAEESAEWRALVNEVSSAIDTAPDPWREMLKLSLTELSSADRLYVPTAFWQPGVRALMADMEAKGLDTFKSWPSSHFFFYQLFAPVFTNAMVTSVMPLLRAANPKAPERWLNSHLVGASEANRDMDVALAQLDADALPLQIDSFGESAIGRPPQRYHLFGPDGPTYGRPYLNYLKLITAASRYIDHPVDSVLEIGAGFGALGEVLISSMPDVQYVDIDIPPLSVVAHYYLSQCFPDRQLLSSLDIRSGSNVTLSPGGPSACLSAWDLPAVTGNADLFVNAFSFQEMEPHVVRNYAEQIARLNTRTVVSVNTRAGKPIKGDAAIGVVEQVTTSSIITTFEQLGYELVGRVGRPAAPPQAELVVLRRS